MEFEHKRNAISILNNISKDEMLIINSLGNMKIIEMQKSTKFKIILFNYPLM